MQSPLDTGLCWQGLLKADSADTWLFLLSLIALASDIPRFEG